MTPAPYKTLDTFADLQSRGICTDAMRKAAGEYREALEHMQRSIACASDDKERETLCWLREQWDQQGVQRLMREASAEQKGGGR